MADDRGLRRPSRVSSKWTNIPRSVVASVALLLSSSESWSWHESLSPNVRSIRIRKLASVISSSWKNWNLFFRRIYRISTRDFFFSSKKKKKRKKMKTRLIYHLSRDLLYRLIGDDSSTNIVAKRVIPVIEEHRFGVSQISERLSFQVVLGTVSFHDSKLSRGEQISARCFNRQFRAVSPYEKRDSDDFLLPAPIFYSLFLSLLFFFFLPSFGNFYNEINISFSLIIFIQSLYKFSVQELTFFSNQFAVFKSEFPPKNFTNSYRILDRDRSNSIFQRMLFKSFVGQRARDCTNEKKVITGWQRERERERERERHVRWNDGSVPRRIPPGMYLRSFDDVK